MMLWTKNKRDEKSSFRKEKEEGRENENMAVGEIIQNFLSRQSKHEKGRQTNTGKQGYANNPFQKRHHANSTLPRNYLLYLECKHIRKRVNLPRHEVLLNDNFEVRVLTNIGKIDF